MKRTITATVLIAAASCAMAQENKEPQPQEAQQQDKTYIVRTTKPYRTSIAETVSQTGSLEAPAIVQVLPKVVGRLVATASKDGANITEGTRVSKGEIIAKIEASDYAARLEASKAGLAYAKASLDDAKKEFSRTEALLKVNTATEQEADRAFANLERAKAAHGEAEANLALAQINFDETDIRAPFDGVISKKHAYVGAMLSQTTPVYTITEVDKLRVFFDVPTTIFSKLAPGETQIKVTVDAYPEEKLDLTLYSVHPVASGLTRTVRIELQLDNPDGKYLPGMYAKGEISLNNRENALVIPYTSFIPLVNGAIVYKVEDDRAVTTAVKLGIRYDEVIEVLDGLNENDVIVTAGHHRLSDGAKISIEKAE